MNTLKRLLLLSLLLLGSLAWATPKAMIIFDASGSMWGQIDGVNKIVIARDALKSVVQKWNPAIPLGLTVYGHRTKGDCNDIETVIPIGPVNRQRMIDTVMGIMPKGRTPIARSLRRVADTLRGNEDPTTIILISDGRESCDADPCATARQLKAEGINFVAHVVGFNVDARTDRQLACIAHATGGEYFSAKNAAALNNAIRVIAKKVEKPKPRPKPKPKITRTVLKLGARYNLLPKGLNISGVHWKVTQNGKLVYDRTETDPEIPLPVAPIHIEADYTEASVPQRISGDVALKPQKVNTVLIQLKSGQVTIDAAEEEGGPKVKASVRIYPVKNGQAQLDNEFGWCIPTPSEPCVRLLPVGDYLAKATYNGMNTEQHFSLKDREKKSLHLYFRQTGTVAVSASETEGGKWIQAEIREIRDAEGERVKSGYRTEVKEAKTFRLPVGKYFLDMRYNRFEKKNIPFEIKPGETTKVHVVMGQTGTVAISASETEGGKWVRAYIGDIYNAQGERISLGGYDTGPKEPKTFRLPVGKYFVNLRYKNFQKRKVPFEIKAGQTTKLHVVFAPVHISVRGIHPCTRVHFELISPEGQVLHSDDAPARKGVAYVVEGERAFIEASAGTHRAKAELIPSKNREVVLDFGASEQVDGISGIWETSEGKATLKQSGKTVRGTYEQDHGVIVGEMTYPRRFEGYWIEDRSDKKCATPREGRYYWGRVIWNFDKERCRFSGEWSYCDETPRYSWRGKFLRPLPPEEEHRELIEADTPKRSSPAGNTSTSPTAPAKASSGPREALRRLDRAADAAQQAQTPEEQLREMQKVMQALGGLTQTVQPASGTPASKATKPVPADAGEDDLKLLNE
jgi:Ca-activated chloride channel family protein